MEPGERWMYVGGPYYAGCRGVIEEIGDKVTLLVSRGLCLHHLKPLRTSITVDVFLDEWIEDKYPGQLSMERNI